MRKEEHGGSCRGQGKPHSSDGLSSFLKDALGSLRGGPGGGVSMGAGPPGREHCVILLAGFPEGFFLFDESAVVTELCKRGWPKDIAFIYHTDTLPLSQKLLMED